MIVRIVCIVLSAVLAFGAVKELLAGILDGEVIPIAIGGLGLMVCVACAWVSLAGARGVAIRSWIPIASAGLVAAFHVVAALPPHRIVGVVVALIALVLAALMLVNPAPRQ